MSLLNNGTRVPARPQPAQQGMSRPIYIKAEKPKRTLEEGRMAFSMPTMRPPPPPRARPNVPLVDPPPLELPASPPIAYSRLGVPTTKKPRTQRDQYQIMLSSSAPIEGGAFLPAPAPTTSAAAAAGVDLKELGDFDLSSLQLNPDNTFSDSDSDDDDMPPRSMMFNNSDITTSISTTSTSSVAVPITGAKPSGLRLGLVKAGMRRMSNTNAADGSMAPADYETPAMPIMGRERTGSSARIHGTRDDQLYSVEELSKSPTVFSFLKSESPRVEQRGLLGMGLGAGSMGASSIFDSSSSSSINNNMVSNRPVGIMSMTGAGSSSRASFGPMDGAGMGLPSGSGVKRPAKSADDDDIFDFSLNPNDDSVLDGSSDAFEF